jgi:hypothetical protein
MCKIWLFQITAQPCGEKKISYGRFLTCSYKECAGTCLTIMSAEAIRDGSTYCQKMLVDWTLVATSPACSMWITPMPYVLGHRCNVNRISFVEFHTKIQVMETGNSESSRTMWYIHTVSNNTYCMFWRHAAL